MAIEGNFEDIVVNIGNFVEGNYIIRSSCAVDDIAGVGSDSWVVVVKRTVRSRVFQELLIKMNG